MFAFSLPPRVSSSSRPLPLATLIRDLLQPDTDLLQRVSQVDSSRCHLQSNAYDILLHDNMHYTSSPFYSVHVVFFPYSLFLKLLCVLCCFVVIQISRRRDLVHIARLHIRHPALPDVYTIIASFLNGFRRLPAPQQKCLGPKL